MIQGRWTGRREGWGWGGGKREGRDRDRETGISGKGQE